MLFDRYGQPVDQPQPEVVPGPPTTSTPLTSIAAVYNLFYLVGDHRFVDDIVSSYDTWEELREASPTDRAYKVGVWAASLQLPYEPHPFPDLPSEVSAITRYEPGYPAVLRDLPDAPCILYVMGSQAPPGPYLTIGGSYYPSLHAKEMTRVAVSSAVEQDMAIVGVLDSGCGHMALQEAVTLGGRSIAVASGDLGTLAAHSLMVRRILDNGGAVISEWGPGEPWTADRTFYASRLAVALASAVVIPEVGSYPTGGEHLARYTISLGRYIIIPAPRSEAETPFSGGGTATLAKASNFREEVFGTGPRIRSRLLAGFPPADAVVENPRQLVRALGEVVANS